LRGSTAIHSSRIYEGATDVQQRIIARAAARSFRKGNTRVAALSDPTTVPYRKQVLVRFGDCDAAGIVFYPRYLEMFNSLVEDWYRDALLFSFTEIVTTRGWGLPTVHLEVDFAASSVFGEHLSATLYVREIGTSSLTLDISLQGPDGSDRVRGKIVLVLSDRRNHKAIPIPADVRRRILAFKAASGDSIRSAAVARKAKR
jgi:4-hydroxybenzoyl-CoA thioesterase